MSYDRDTSRDYRDDRGSSSRGYDDHRSSSSYGGGYGSSSSRYGGGGGYDRPPMPRGRRLYVSGTGNASTDDIERLFEKYGRIVDIAVKAGFCFVEFSDERDAADAVYGRDGYEWRGARLRVEHCKPRGAARDAQFGLQYGGQGGYPQYPTDRPPPKCFNCSQEGHLARDCKAGDWSNRCYFCKEEGHKTMTCPAKAAQFGTRPGQAVPPPASSSATTSSGRARSRSRSPRRRSRSRSRDREERRSSRSRSRSRGRDSMPAANDASNAASNDQKAEAPASTDATAAQTE